MKSVFGTWLWQIQCVGDGVEETRNRGKKRLYSGRIRMAERGGMPYAYFSKRTRLSLPVDPPRRKQKPGIFDE